MTKTVSLPDLVYADLVSLSGTLTTMAKKPISLGMTVQITTSAYRLFLSIPQFEEKIKMALSSPDTMTPEQWEETWNKFSKDILGGKKGSE